jgi:hypothetical protein
MLVVFDTPKLPQELDKILSDIFWPFKETISCSLFLKIAMNSKGYFDFIYHLFDSKCFRCVVLMSAS